jgi:hypothetical protein
VPFKFEGIVTALKGTRDASYRRTQQGGGGLDLPSPRNVAEAIGGVTSALFPRRYGGARAGSSYSLDYFVGHTLGKSRS